MLILCSSSFSAQGDLGPLLCVNSSRCLLLPPYRITDMGWHTKERVRCCCGRRDRCAVCQIPAWTGNVINIAAPHKRSHGGHLTCLSPAGCCTSSGQQHPLDPPCRDLMTVCQPSICSSSFFLWLIQDHGCPADCFTCLTNSFGSGWLPHLTMSWFLDPHCPADPPGDV